MRKSACAIFIVILVMTFSCDSIEGTFDESVPNFYSLTTHVAPQQAGTLQPSSGEFLQGNSVQIVARPAEGYVFEYWEGDLTGSSNPAFIQFNSNKSVTAHFSLRDYDLNIEIVGSGVVNETVIERTSSITVSLAAEAEEGWYFDRWEGDLSGSSNPETITIEADKEKSVTAVFLEEIVPEYSLNVTIEGDGSVAKNPDRSSYTEGEEVTLTASAASGWSFIEWGGDLSGSANPRKIVMDNDKKITAVFEVDIDFGIAIDEVKLFIEEMELDGARRTRDFKTKDFILNLPLDGSPFQITHVQIPAGFYDELDLDIKKPSSSADVDDPDFVDGSKRYSLVVKGVFNGVDFTFQSDEDFQINVDLSPHLEIKSGQTSVIAITVDFEEWFKGKDSIFLDPNDPKNTKQINQNIEDSFSDFENDF